MRLSPLSAVSHKREKIAFGALKFELDKSTKEYLLKLSKEENLSAQDILEVAKSTDKMVKNLTTKANNIAQEIIDNSPLNGKTLEDVWRDDTVVKVNVKPKRYGQDKLILNAYFNDNLYIEENSGRLYHTKGIDTRTIGPYDLWSFISELSTGYISDLSHFVEKALKKKSQFNELLQNNGNIPNFDKKEEEAKLYLKKWLNK